MSTDTQTSTAPKPKKSVALSGVVAGNTALCTVGRTGNDLHSRARPWARCCRRRKTTPYPVRATSPTA